MGLFHTAVANWSEILSMAAPDMARYVKGIATGLSHVYLHYVEEKLRLALVQSVISNVTPKEPIVLKNDLT